MKNIDAVFWLAIVWVMFAMPAKTGASLPKNIRHGVSVSLPPAPDQNNHREIVRNKSVLKDGFDLTAAIPAPGQAVSFRLASQYIPGCKGFGCVRPIVPVALNSRAGGTGFVDRLHNKPVKETKLARAIRQLKSPKGYSANYFLTQVM